MEGVRALSVCLDNRIVCMQIPFHISLGAEETSGNIIMLGAAVTLVFVDQVVITKGLASDLGLGYHDWSWCQRLSSSMSSQHWHCY